MYTAREGPFIERIPPPLNVKVVPTDGSDSFQELNSLPAKSTGTQKKMVMGGGEKNRDGFFLKKVLRLTHLPKNKADALCLTWRRRVSALVSPDP